MQEKKLQQLQIDVQQKHSKTGSLSETHTHQSTHGERHMLHQKCDIFSEMQMLSQTLRRENNATNPVKNESAQVVFRQLHQETRGCPNEIFEG